MQLGVQLYARLCSLDPSTEAANYQVTAASEQSTEAWDIDGLWSDIRLAEERTEDKERTRGALSPPVEPKVSQLEITALSPSDLAMVRALFDEDATSSNNLARRRHRRHRRHHHAERRAAEDRREVEEGRRRRRNAQADEGREGGGVGGDTRREAVVLGRRRLSADRTALIHAARAEARFAPARLSKRGARGGAKGSDAGLKHDTENQAVG